MAEEKRYGGGVKDLTLTQKERDTLRQLHESGKPFTWKPIGVGLGHGSFFTLELRGYLTITRDSEKEILTAELTQRGREASDALFGSPQAKEATP